MPVATRVPDSRLVPPPPVRSEPARQRCSRRRMLLAVLAGFAAFMLLGNGAIATASWWLQGSEAGPIPRLPGVENVRLVDDRVIRGDAPSAEGLRALAAIGVTTVVDLRAERGIHVDNQLFDELDLRRVSMPVRDGQRPTDAQVQRFLELVEGEKGLVFVHCGAGVGRTGAMAAAYTVLTGKATGPQAMRANLAVGPPSLEQLSYAFNVRQGEIAEPHPALVAASRVLDAPRRLWSYVH